MLEELVQKLGKSRELATVLASADAIKASPLFDDKDEPMRFATRAFKFFDALEDIEDAITDMKQEMEVGLEQTVMRIASDEGADAAVSIGALSYVFRRINCPRYGESQSVNRICEVEVATWFFQSLVDHVSKNGAWSKDMKYLVKLVVNGGPKREAFFNICISAFPISGLGFGEVTFFLTSYVSSAKRTTEPSVIAFCRRVWTERPDFLEDFKQYIAIELLRNAGAAAAGVFDIAFQLYVESGARDEIVLRLIYDCGGSEYMEVILKKIEDAVSKNTLTLSQAFPALRCFGDRYSAFRPRVEVVLSVWLEKMCLGRGTAYEMTQWLKELRGFDLVSHALLDDIFMWIWNQKRIHKRFSDDIRPALQLSGVFAAVARKSSYRWSKLEGLLNGWPRIRLSSDQFIVVCAAAESCAIPRWVGSVAKANLRELHPRLTHLCPMNLLFDYGGALPAPKIEQIERLIPSPM